MELLNSTALVVGCCMAIDPDGAERMVVVAKGTFALPAKGQAPALLSSQLPLVEADSFTGDPGLSAVIHEYDFAPCKPRCDVLLNGFAYSPNFKAARHALVSLDVGPMHKSFEVVGDRVWQRGLLGPRPGRPTPFERMDISYDRAYGGTDSSDVNGRVHGIYGENPVGVGYHVAQRGSAVIGQPLPNTQERGRPVSHLGGSYRPMSFGSVGRNWEPRVSLAGTYNDAWNRNKFPFLPDDFDEAYYQSAPPDQQIPYLKGGERVRLAGLSSRGTIEFCLPELHLPVLFQCRGPLMIDQNAVVDTLLLEPEFDRFSLVWRTSLAVTRSLFEIYRAWVGETDASRKASLKLVEEYEIPSDEMDSDST